MDRKEIKREDLEKITNKLTGLSAVLLSLSVQYDQTENTRMNDREINRLLTFVIEELEKQTTILDNL